MKKQAFGIIALIALIYLPSCKELKPNDALIEQMKDSIHKIYFVPYKSIKVEEHSDVTVTIGSKQYFDGPEEQREKMTREFAAMSVHFFEENNYLDEGKVVFVPNETTIPTDADPKKEYDMHLDELLKKK